ncbi:hypothetical protein MF271_07995 [Deinococcus sp. KNUC1210]|uniref:hypothetical protein n=1 Tax=Deinococcus sp. KNUC1210 TaxID=2917691 RepID=UPI001EF10661|nr:hypothetical protein [Deinococcus sp. KNUC1210]ULH16505.1 hypothetical protein MF271_07995 [Deinococcus sp. KNUC1210]
MKMPLPTRGLLRLRGRLAAQPPAPDYSRLLTGADALSRLDTLDQAQAERLLSACAAALSLYPAWERRDWAMPEAQAALTTHGGHFLNLERLAARLGGVHHVPGRHSYLHASSGLTFAALSQEDGVTLVLGGTNSSHSDRQPVTFSAEVKQVQADFLNMVGRVPRLYRAADLLTLLARAELSEPLTLTGHSLGGGLAQYAALMNDLPALAFSPTALGRGVLALLYQLGRLANTERILERVQAYSLDGDPIPTIGTGWFQSRVVGCHLRLPLSPDVPPARHATSHGQIYPHLLMHLQRTWPDLKNALEVPS